LQVSSVNAQSAAAKAAAKGGLISTFMEIGKSEGIRGYWRGNVPQVRVPGTTHPCAVVFAGLPPAFPASGAARAAVQRVPAVQAREAARRAAAAAALRFRHRLTLRARRSYEKLKTLLADKDGKLSVPARLAAGAGAACLSTIVRSRRTPPISSARAR
jgi:hypothetical protein